MFQSVSYRVPSELAYNIPTRLNETFHIVYKTRGSGLIVNLYGYNSPFLVSLTVDVYHFEYTVVRRWLVKAEVARDGPNCPILNNV